MAKAQQRARLLLWSGMAIFGVLGIATVVWWLAAGELSLSYALVMIPLSAVAVICIFNASLVRVYAGLEQMHDLNAWVANHEERLSSVEEQVMQMREFLVKRHNYAQGYVDAAMAGENPANGAVLRFAPRSKS